MPRQPKLNDQEAEFLRRRQEEATQAIAGYKAAAKLLNETRAKRADAIAQLDKLVAEAEGALKDAMKVLVNTIGVSGAQSIGLALKPKRGGRPRKVEPQLPPPPVWSGGDAA